MPKVSVVMPAYNAEKYIGEAIDSILNQTFTDFEFIIINDGSTDKTKDIILSYSDKRIVYLENEKNSGIVFTLNKGLDRSHGEYIARMDSDDISLPTRLKKQVEFLELNKDIGLLGTGIKVLNGENEQVILYRTDPKELKAELLFSSCLAHPTVMMRKSVLKDNNLFYDKNFQGREDFALWWEFAKVSKISTIPETLLCYRIHDNQITKKRDAESIINSKNLLDLRLKYLNINLSDYEKKCMYKYCVGKFDEFSKKDLECFIFTLKKIYKNNDKTMYFSKSVLKKIFALAVLYILQNSFLSKKEENKILKSVITNSAISDVIILKYLLHRILKRLG